MNIHGGNTDYYKQKTNRKELLNFSSNSNPIKLHDDIINKLDFKAIIKKYPDENYENLRTSIQDYTGVNKDNILVGNGATELIANTIKAINPKKAMNIEPAYSEYKNELNKINCDIFTYFLEEHNDFAISDDIYNFLDQIELLILCNPNNPTGTFLDEHSVNKLLEKCKRHNVIVMVDETYAEFSRKQSALNLIKEYDNLVVIRGTSKFFGISGLRLGYVLTSNNYILDTVKHNLLLWNVNSVAEALGQLIFTDKKFINDTLELTEKELKYFKKEISKIDTLQVYDTNSNFFIVKILNDKKASEFQQFCLKQGYIIRDLSDYGFKQNGDKFFRISVLEHDKNILLMNSIKHFFHNNT